MTDPRKPIFDALRTAKGGKLSGEDVTVMDAALDRLNMPREDAVKTMKDPAVFFAGVRKITGPLNTTQVETINGLLVAAAHWPLGWLAYGLATAWHEARLMPIEEIGKGKGRPYAASGKYGQAQYGRGLVQLTWDRNYEWADAAAAKAGLLPAGAILQDFSLVMRPDIAAFILVHGMETGAFTGKALKDYVGSRGTVDQFTAARRIINGTDRAAMIADYGVQFQDALAAGGWG